jgi:hypothetical protein
VDLRIVGVHGVLKVRAVQVGVHGGMRRREWGGYIMVRRVLNGPCAGGHVGQVARKVNSHGVKGNRALGVFKA